MEAYNPYKASDATFSNPHSVGEIASKSRRFGTFVVDYALYYAICAALGVAVALGFGISAVEGGSAYLISVPAFLLYYIGFESLFGRTPGKFVFGTRVLSDSGAAPTLGQVAGRTLSRFIPFEPLSVLFSSTNLGWHDSISRTKVITTRNPHRLDNRIR